MLTLHCPDCGYNLTGLPENRCPECGREFDPASVVAAQGLVTPLDWRGAFYRLMVLPAIPWLLGLLLVRDTEGVYFLVMIGLGLMVFVQLVAGPIYAWYWAGRLVEGRALREQRTLRPGDRRYVWKWAVGLLVIQTALTFGSIAAVWSLADINGFIAGV